MVRMQCVLLVWALSSTLGAQDDAQFKELAAAATKSLGLATEPAAVNFDAEVVATKVLSLRLGAIEFLYPKAGLQSAQDLTDLQQGAIAVCNAQRLLHDWMSATPAPPEFDTAHRSVQAWLKGWRWPTIPPALTTVSDDVAAAQRQFTAGMAKLLAREPEACRAQAWLAPTRQNFCEMCGLLGAIAPENRELVWQKHILRSSEAWVSRPRTIQIVAMEYAPPEELLGEHGITGVRMDAREKGGLLQHVVQRAMSSLVVMAFGDNVDRDFEAGLCQDLVVALLKENNARTGGSGLGGYAAAREQFVAGGASSGGALAAINLDSQWRQTKGKDYFIRPLKQGQRNGSKHAAAKEPKDKIGNFLLQDDNGKPDHVVRAPFLGPPAKGLPSVPANYDADFKELLRAYRSGFVFWLRESAGKSTGDSKLKFAGMLRELAEGGGKVTFELACRRAFGERLSADGPTPPSLEWRFLAWLQR